MKIGLVSQGLSCGRLIASHRQKREHRCLIPNIIEQLESRTLLTAPSGWSMAIGGVGNDAIRDIVETPDGNIVVIGSFSNTADFDPGHKKKRLTAQGDMDGFLAKYTPARDLVWVKKISGSSTITPVEVASNSAGDIYVAGNFMGTADFGDQSLVSSGGQDMFAAKFDSTGSLEWVTSMGGAGNEWGLDMALGQDERLYVSGSFRQTVEVPTPGGTITLTAAGTGVQGDGYVATLSPIGEFQGVRQIGGPFHDSIYGVAVDVDGAVYAAGPYNDLASFGMDNFQNPVTLHNSSTTNNTFLVKWDSGGAVSWIRNYSSNSVVNRPTVRLDSLGNAYVVGRFSGTVNIGSGTASFKSTFGLDAHISKWNPNGDFIWARHIPSIGALTVSSAPSALAVDHEGAVYAGGNFDTSVDFDPGPIIEERISTGLSTSKPDGFVLKLTTDGDFEWAQTYPSDGAAEIQAIAFDTDNNVLAGGNFTNNLFTPTGEVLATNGSEDAILTRMTQVSRPADIILTSLDDFPTTGEDGRSASFVVSLTRAPNSNVIVPIETSNISEGMATVGSVVFTPADWRDGRVVTVVGTDDTIRDGDKSYALVAGPAQSADQNYDGLNASDALITNLDNETGGLIFWVRLDGLVQRSNLDGSNVSTIVDLPALFNGTSSDYSLRYTAIDPEAGHIYWTDSKNGSTIWRANFDGSNVIKVLEGPGSVRGIALDIYGGKIYWGDQQSINRANLDGTQVESLIVGNFPTAKELELDLGDGKVYWTDSEEDVIQRANLDGTNVETVVTLLDEDDLFVASPYGLALDSDSGLMYWSDRHRENVDRSTLDGDQIVNIANVSPPGPIERSDARSLDLDPSAGKLYWTDDDQHGVYRASVDGSTMAQLVVGLSRPQGLAVLPNGINVQSSSELSTSEAGTTASFDIVLNAPPTEEVMIAVSTSDPTEGTPSLAQVVFTPANWNIPQTVIVTGVDDVVTDGDISYVIELASAVSSDMTYDGLDPVDVVVTNEDDESSPGISVTPVQGLSTTESGQTDSFAIVLDSAPTADVTISLSSSDITEGTVSPSSVTFTPSNWNTPQTVTVSGVDDSVPDGDANYTILTDSAISADQNYSGIDAADVSAINLDNDTAGVIYVWDINFESKRRGRNTDYRVIVFVKQDSDLDGVAESNDDSILNAAVTVDFAGRHYTGTTDSNGVFRSSWVKGLGSGSHRAEVIDLVLAGFLWDPNDLLDATANDADDDGDGKPDDVLNI